MATFCDLPLEVVRFILEFALTPPLDVFRRVLNLRLVNSVFDQEVMLLIGKLELLRHESVRCRTIPWYHPNDGAAITLESMSLFLARYVLDRPHVQSPWRANFSALLNHMADTVLEHLQPPDEDEGESRRRRHSMMTAYCRWMLNRPDKHVTDRCIGWAWRNEDLDNMPGNPPGLFFDLLYPENGRVTDHDYEWVFDNAWGLFGPLQSEGLDMTWVNKAMISK
ncbi:hypothetical protein PG984_013925 [Apiospora sp. TS-2023a]